MPPVVLLIHLLLYRSINACNARVLFDVSSTDSAFKSFGVAKQLNETLLLPVIPSLRGVVPVDTIKGGASAKNGKLKGLEKQTKDAEWKRPRVLSAAAVQNPSHMKVSWRVPRDGRRERPRFDVDYVGPRTHPPSHN